ncbi:MAG: site-specific integrase [Actinobacteria bacterium]|nr:site-specific integrase [Actinomycetota bacterium]
MPVRLAGRKPASLTLRPAKALGPGPGRVARSGLVPSDPIASSEDAAALLAALPEEDRALWAAALYGGLRRGELMALDWQDVDLAAGVIRVERSYDAKAGQYVKLSGREVVSKTVTS